jgi:hypothetical protein
MDPSAATVFVLCTGTSALCTWLLFRSYARSRTRLLIWSALCFLLLTANNLLVFMDLIMLPSFDLSMARLATSLAAVSLLVYGFIWDA